MTDLTDRQRDVLGFMLTFCAENKRPPGVREIGAWLGIKSNNAVMEHLHWIAKKGYVAQAKERGRQAWWPVRDIDGAPIRWRLTYERTDA